MRNKFIGAFAYSIAFTFIIVGLFFSSHLTTARKYTRAIEDFSCIHGEGVSYSDGVITVVDNNSYFIVDIGKQSNEYYAIKLKISEVFTQEGPMQISIGHSSAGDESDIEIEKNVKVTSEEVSCISSFEHDQYLRFIIDAPQGTSFRLNELDLLKDCFKPDRWILYLMSFLLVSLFVLFSSEVIERLLFIVQKHACSLGIIIEIGILLFFVISGKLMYALNDDTLKVAMAGGAYGVPSQYLGYNTIHVFLGYLFKLLFTFIPIINWVTVFYLIVATTSSFLLIRLLSLEVLDSKMKVLAVFAVDLYFFLCLSYFTFTIIAYTAAIVAGAYFYRRIGLNGSVIDVWIGGILIFCACIIRPAVCYSILIVLGINSVYRLLHKRDCNGLKYVLLCFAILQLTQLSNRLIVNCSDIEAFFYKWSEVRVAALDTKQVPWEQYSMELEAAGITKDNYDIIYSARYVDYDAVSLEKLSVIRELSGMRNDKYNTSPMSYLSQIFSPFYNMRISAIDLTSIYKYAYLLFVIVFLVNHFHIETIALLLSPIIVESIFVFLNRDLYRVTMPVYFFSVFLIFLCQSKKTARVEDKRVDREIGRFLGVICPTVLALLCFSAFQNKWEAYDYSYCQEANKIIQYIETNNEKLFLPISSELYSIEVYRPVFEFAGQNGICYLCGNGESYGEAYYQVMESLGIESPDHVIIEAIDNKKILIVGTSNTEESNQLYSPIISYASKKVGKELYLRKEDKISKNYATYSLTSK